MQHFSVPFKSLNVPLTTSLWIYSVHSNNAELFHFLEENMPEPSPELQKDIFEESIKCHHNNFANYIINNYKISEDDIISCIFGYRNYSFFSYDFDFKSEIYYLSL